VSEPLQEQAAALARELGEGWAPSVGARGPCAQLEAPDRSCMWVVSRTETGDYLAEFLGRAYDERPGSLPGRCLLSTFGMGDSPRKALTFAFELVCTRRDALVGALQAEAALAGRLVVESLPS